MSQVITINNFGSNNIIERLELNADAAASATVLTLFNTQGATTTNPFYLGQLGSETGEVVTPSSIDSSTQITSPAIKFKHFRNDPCTVLFGNQIKVYRAANTNGLQPADASFSVLGSATAIDFDQPTTNITDAAGDSNYWYKFTYFNSVTSAESSLAESVSSRGGNYGNYCSIEDIRTQAGLQRARYVTDVMIDKKRQAAQQSINSALSGIYSLPFTNPVNAWIQEITIKLAAGWLLMEQFDQASANFAKGEKLILSITNKDGTGDLDKIQSGSSSLVDAAGADTSSSSTSIRMNGWPDNTTADAESTEAGGDHMFRVSDASGQGIY